MSRHGVVARHGTDTDAAVIQARITAPRHRAAARIQPGPSPVVTSPVVTSPVVTSHPQRHLSPPLCKCVSDGIPRTSLVPGAALPAFAISDHGDGRVFFNPMPDGEPARAASGLMPILRRRGTRASPSSATPASICTSAPCPCRRTPFEANDAHPSPKPGHNACGRRGGVGQAGAGRPGVDVTQPPRPPGPYAGRPQYPVEAVAAHRALGCRLPIGMHFGTVQLTDEPVDEPAARLAAAAADLVPGTFTTLAFGETRYAPLW